MLKDTKDTQFKFRLSTNEKAALRRAAKRAKISYSQLLRLMMNTRHNVHTKPNLLRAALGK